MGRPPNEENKKLDLRTTRKTIKEEDLLTVLQAAALIQNIQGSSFSAPRLYQIISAGRIEVVILGDRMYIKRQVAEAFARSRRRPGRPRTQSPEERTRQEEIARIYGQK